MANKVFDTIKKLTTRKRKKPVRKRLTPGLARIGQQALKRGAKVGAGRPTGTYKYGMPISVYKKLLAQKKRELGEYKLEQSRKFARRGLSPEQVKLMQWQRTVEERLPQQQQQIKKGDGPERMVDDELAFDRWRAEKKLSPSAEQILTRLRRVQNKGKRDNIRQQRIHEERRIISDKGNLMKAHENMININMDFTNVDPETNILMAPSVFKEDARENLLRTNKLNILQTREAGNSLFFG